jgi:hypothetical protein
MTWIYTVACLESAYMKSIKLFLAIAATGMLAIAANAQSFSTNALPAPVALGVVGNIHLLGNDIVADSYNSQDPTESINGLWNGYSGTNGNLASVQGIVDIGNHLINGNLYLGPNATYDGSGMVAGTIYSCNNLQFPDVSLPTNDASGNPIVWTPAPGKTSAHTFANSGYYIITDNGSVTVSPGVTVTLDVRTTSYFPSGLTINGGTTNAGTVIMYQESGSLTLNMSVIGGAINNRPKNFFYFGLPGVT